MIFLGEKLFGKSFSPNPFSETFGRSIGKLGVYSNEKIIISDFSLCMGGGVQ